MSIFTAMKTAYSLEDAFGAKDCTTQEMKEAIDRWFQLYYEQMPTKDEDPCQRIAYTIVNKITKTSFGEYNAMSEDEFAQAVLDALDKCKKKAMQKALVGGETFLKPVPGAEAFSFQVISRDNVLIFGREPDGTPVDVGTMERAIEGSKYYTLLERRTVGGDGRLTIRNKLYVSEAPGTIGQPVSLQALDRYKNLPAEYTFQIPLGGIGLIRMQTPMENCIDGSNDGVSVYAPAVGLIRNINRNEALINGEFERGQSRVFVSDDLLKRDKEGRKQFSDNVFVGLDDDQESVGVTIFSPALREQSYLNRKKEYLRNVENVIGLKRGLLSEVETVEKTAKEITSSAGDYNLTIIDFQQMWHDAVLEAVRVCGILGKLYRVPGAHEVDPDAVAIDWGNGILYDEDATWADYKDMAARGMLKEEIALGWRFNMPADTPEEQKAIREKYMPTSAQLMAGDE